MCSKSQAHTWKCSHGQIVIACRNFVNLYPLCLWGMFPKMFPGQLSLCSYPPVWKSHHCLSVFVQDPLRAWAKWWSYYFNFASWRKKHFVELSDSNIQSRDSLVAEYMKPKNACTDSQNKVRQTNSLASTQHPKEPESRQPTKSRSEPFILDMHNSIG